MEKKFIRDDKYSVLRFLYKNPGIVISIFTLVPSFTSLVINNFYSMILRSYYKYWGYNLEISRMPNNSITMHFFVIFGICFLFLFCLLFFPSIKDYMNAKHSIDGVVKSFDEDTQIITNETNVEDNYKDVKAELIELRTSMQKTIVMMILSKAAMIFFFSYTFILSVLPLNSFSMLKEYGFAMGVSILIAICSIIKSLVYYFKSSNDRFMKGLSNEDRIIEASELIKDLSSNSFPNGILRSLTNGTIGSLCRYYFSSLFFIAGIIVLYCPLAIKINKTFLVTRIDSNEYAIIAQNDDTYYLNSMKSIDDYALISRTYHRVLTTLDLSYEKRRFNIVIQYTDDNNLNSILSLGMQNDDSGLSNLAQTDNDS